VKEVKRVPYKSPPCGLCGVSHVFIPAK
jgi:hypothetical protein